MSGTVPVAGGNIFDSAESYPSASLAVTTIAPPVAWGDEGNVETIQTTDEHPFWVDGRGWTNAGDLTAGDLLQESDGTWQQVLSSTRDEHAEGITVYNFQVAGDHTYFVADGAGAEDAVWVHNAGCGDIPDLKPAKIAHVWDKVDHQLDAVWQAFGSKAKAHQALINKMHDIVARDGLPPLGTHLDHPTPFAGYDVTLRIQNVGGEARLSTAFLTGSGTP